ncbi:hypothetical protein [Micrococcus terreus]|uniref:hypothetical protein n=1 Tax=Micrococcus terreus TaxID=574650 RepID=UPI003019F0FB
MKNGRTRVVPAILLAGALTAGGAWAVVASPGDLEDKQGGAGVAQVNPQDGSPVQVDAQDNVVKTAGETGGLVDSTGQEVFTVQVESVTAHQSCPARVGDRELSSVHGTFLYVDVRAELDEAVGQSVDAAEDELFLPLAVEAFTVTGPDGTVYDLPASEMSWGCLTDDELLPPVINPGQTLEGIVVLDVPVTEGTVTYDPDRTGGWSWTFGS